MKAPHADIRNPELAADRTVQDWHRNAFPRTAGAIDVDLMGWCNQCRAPLYLIESTTNPNKITTVIRALSERAHVPAYVILHNQLEPTRAWSIWPPPVRVDYTIPELEFLLMAIRADCANRGHKPPKWMEAV